MMTSMAYVYCPLTVIIDSDYYFIIQYNNSIGNNNNKVNELYSLFLKFSALGLLHDIRNNFHS